LLVREREALIKKHARGIAGTDLGGISSKGACSLFLLFGELGRSVCSLPLFSFSLFFLAGWLTSRESSRLWPYHFFGVSHVENFLLSTVQPSLSLSPFVSTCYTPPPSLHPSLLLLHPFHPFPTRRLGSLLTDEA